MKNLEDLRTNYDLDRLEFKNLNKNPMIQFKIWFEELNKKNDFNAFILSTFSKLNGVHSRVVLLKDFDKNGFVFYTNYNSLKAKQIDENNDVSMCFFGQIFKDKLELTGMHLKPPVIFQIYILVKDLENLSWELGLHTKVRLFSIKKL